MKHVFSRIQGAAAWLTILIPPLMLTGPAPADIAVWLVDLFFLLHAAHRRDWQWLRWRWVQLLAIFWIYIATRDALLADPHRFLLTLSWLHLPLFGIALARWVLPDPRVRRRLWLSLAASVAFLVIDSFWQYVFRVDLAGHEVGQFTNRYGSAFRLTGPFRNARVGITLTWLIYPVLAQLLAQRGFARQLLAGACTLACIAAIYLSGERNALMLLASPHGRRAIPALALGFALLGGIAFLHHPAMLDRQFGSSYDQGLHFFDSPYGKGWRSAWDIALAHPFIGVGAHQYHTECLKPEYGPTDADSLFQRCLVHPHNHYLNTASAYGFIGLALHLAWLAGWILCLRRGWPHRLADDAGMGLCIAALLWLWPISVAPGQFVPWVAIPFWLVAGWLTSLTGGEKTTA